MQQDKAQAGSSCLHLSHSLDCYKVIVLAFLDVLTIWLNSTTTKQGGYNKVACGDLRLNFREKSTYDRIETALRQLPHSVK